MQKHIKVYFDFFDYCQDEFIPCENCSSKAVDIHHLIFRSHQGNDEIKNLMALCRNCHIKAHSNKEFNEQLKEKHYEYISNRPR